MAQRVVPRETHLAIYFSGVVDSESVQGTLTQNPEALATARTTLRVYFDFSEVTSFAFDPLSLGEAMKTLAANGVRLAIASTNPEYFGVGRQIAQYSGVEGMAINVFTTEEEAVAWLAGCGQADS